jgi:hypothetical protein
VISENGPLNGIARDDGALIAGRLGLPVFVG